MVTRRTLGVGIGRVKRPWLTSTSAARIVSGDQDILAENSPRPHDSFASGLAKASLAAYGKWPELAVA